MKKVPESIPDGTKIIPKSIPESFPDGTKIGPKSVTGIDPRWHHICSKKHTMITPLAPELIPEIKSTYQFMYEAHISCTL